jgi:methyltransferase
MVTAMGLYFTFLAFLILERFGELALSHRNAARAFRRGGVEIGQRHYKVMAAFHTLFILSCFAEASFSTSSVPEFLRWAAFVGALAAQALRYWAITTLGDRWNVRVIFVPGERPVVAGPYRFVRPPNYVAVALELVCVPLMFGGLWTAAIFTLGNTVLMLVRIPAEEAALGQTYARAFSGRPRFVPGAKS